MLRHFWVKVSTDLFGRGIDIERVNIVINYDMPDESHWTKHKKFRASGWAGLVAIFVLSHLWMIEV